MNIINRIDDFLLKQKKRSGYHSYIPRQFRRYECLIDGKRFWTIEALQEHKNKYHTQNEIQEALNQKRQEIERQQKIKLNQQKDKPK